MKIIADRIDGDYITAELPDKTMVKIPLLLVPDAAEGDVIDITVDKSETEKRRTGISNKLNNLFEK